MYLGVVRDVWAKFRDLVYLHLQVAGFTVSGYPATPRWLHHEFELPLKLEPIKKEKKKKRYLEFTSRVPLVASRTP